MRGARVAVQAWLDALEEHSAYSTHYCSQDQSGEEGDDEEVVSVGELTESLQVAVNINNNNNNDNHNKSAINAST